MTSTSLIESEVEWHGQKFHLKHYRISRLMRNEALEAATMAYYKRYNESGGISPTVFERELALKAIKWWDLPQHVTIGWDLLDDELAEIIGKRIGIEEIVKAMKGKTTTEAEQAKNLPSGSGQPVP